MRIATNIMKNIYRERGTGAADNRSIQVISLLIKTNCKLLYSKCNVSLAQSKYYISVEKVTAQEIKSAIS